MKDTVVIVGSHPRTRGEFDFGRTDCDVWLFNEALSKPENKWAKRADAIFQMHEETIWRNPANRNDPNHYEWLKAQTKTTIYMQDVYEDIPMSSKYPLNEILEMIGNSEDHFLTSSVPQAMALAGYLGYKRVELYGVAMETETEYQFQREGVAHWYGFLRGKGVEVVFTDPTFHAPLYGYEGYASISEDAFRNRVAVLQPMIDRIGPEYLAVKVNTDKAISEMLHGDNSKNVFDTVKSLSKKGQEIGVLDGALQENQRYQKKADTMTETTGKFLFSRQEFESAFQNLSQEYMKTVDVVNVVGGQLQLIHENVVRAAKDSPKREKLLDAYKALAQRYFEANNKAAILQGAAQENRNYLSILDKHVRAAGGEKSEAVLLEAMQHA